MATIVHTNWLQLMLGATGTGTVPDFDTDNIDASLIDEADSGAITAATVDYDDITAGEVATSDVAVSGIAGGVVSVTGDITFPTVTGDEAEYLPIWKNSGSPATSPLIITFDSASTGIPVVPNGGDIVASLQSNQLVTLV